MDFLLSLSLEKNHEKAKKNQSNKYTRSCSATLAIRDMQTKTSSNQVRRLQEKVQEMVRKQSDEDEELRVHLCDRWACRMVQPLWKTAQEILILNIELPQVFHF